MTDPVTRDNTLHDYLMVHAPVLFMELDTEGCILKMNRAATEVFGDVGKMRLFAELLVDFSHSFDLSAALDETGLKLMSLVGENGEPQSFRLRFVREGNRILVMGHTDVEDASLMQGEIVRLNQQLNNLTRDLQKKNARLKQALDHVKQLQGIIPICMHCHKIRNDEQIWEQLEAYLDEHTDAQLSHGICPDCMEKYYPDID
ncbi:MAG: hypothetical protein MI802_14060 [Desulfobacterales bacterium]|nr:hypothetical protein [Desulfobacterales bacterium]